jgi:large subunit ribosomal protein L30
MAEETTKPQNSKEKAEKIAVVRIRGSIKMDKELKDTMNMLRLYRQNYCVIVDSTPSIKGMLKKVASYLTWGEVSDETLALLKEKRTEKTKDKKGKEMIKPFFRLHPPRKGFERKGIKIPFKLGGALGYRGEKINDLIKRMI